MYEAIICRVRTAPHPNADKLLIGDAAGYSVIVGIDTPDGELGILFPEGGCIARDFCIANELYRKHPDTGAPLGGYLDEQGRVRALKLRGAVSDALWLPLSSITAWLVALHVAAGHGGRTGVPVFAEGDRVTEIKGHRLCEKYLTPATRAAMARYGTGSLKARAASALPRHYDTPQLRDLAMVPIVSDAAELCIVVTEKIHGTSGRTGRVPVERPLGRIARAWNAMIARVVPALAIRPKTRHEYISGTRNCVLDFGAPGEKGQGYRAEVAAMIEDAGLDHGEVWYYEISGFSDGGVPIMAPHHVEAIGDSKLEAKLRRMYGATIRYTYGCDPAGGGVPRYVVHVYRITQRAPDGRDRELTYDEIVARVDDSGADVDVVPLLARQTFVGGYDTDQARAITSRVMHGAITLANVETPGQPREGVCVRFEAAGEVVSKAYKHKSFVFCALEGIARNDAEYVDTEEVA